MAINEKIKHEMAVLRGDETKEMTYTSQCSFATDAEAQKAFTQSVAKLFDVNGWASLSSLAADFIVHDATGKQKTGSSPEVGDFIQISLPGPVPDNWVRVTHVQADERLAEFVVHPSQAPNEKPAAETAHFFSQEASSTFRVELVGNTIIASEIGKNEAINNQEQAGSRAVVNTLIAEAGWLFYQKFQWKLLTDYLVHL